MIFHGDEADKAYHAETDDDGVSKTYAYGLVAKLEKEGKLRNVGTYRQKLFVKGEKKMKG